MLEGSEAFGVALTAVKKFCVLFRLCKEKFRRVSYIQ